MEQIFEVMKPVIEAWAGNYGWSVQVVAVIGALRLIFKPMMSLVQAIVEVTPSPVDNEVLAKVTAHPVYKFVAYFLDWGASIKLPQKPKA